MAKIAKQHHDNLQDEGTEAIDVLDRKIEEILKEIPEAQKFPDPEDSPLNNLISEKYVEKALLIAKNGSATGLDGLPYKIWKILKKQNDQAEEEGKKGFDTIKTLTTVYQDIQDVAYPPATSHAPCIDDMVFIHEDDIRVFSAMTQEQWEDWLDNGDSCGGCIEVSPSPARSSRRSLPSRDLARDLPGAEPEESG
ncbi:hypothetical protein EDB84DRAFT_1557743 [Lactarius hengduanensis]|nr:hypothetical protein EDB84DRAFT_1557743 [Lactarius hengduanensis]